MKKNSLQRFTEKTNKIEWLFSLKKVTFKELDTLNKTEKKKVFKIMNEKINSLEGIERDKFIEQFIDVWDTSTKNQLWENNHTLITGVISNLLIEYNRMPTITEIAEKTNLSRQTIHKHLQNYKANPIFLEQMEQYKILIPSLIGRVYKIACRGDIGAAKLYFKLMGCLNEQGQNNTLIQNNNNYIQINGLILSQENIRSLNHEQLRTIETIVKTALPQSEY